MLAQHHAVSGANQLNLERRGLLQQPLHLHPKGQHNICVIIRSALHQPLITKLIIIKGVVRANVLAESVIREQNLFFLQISQHGIRPMHHRRGNEMERIFARFQRVAELHQLAVEILLVIGFQSALRARRAVNRRIRDTLKNHRAGAGMVRLDVVLNDVVDTLNRDDLFNVGDKLLGKGSLYVINQNPLVAAVVIHQVCVIGRAEGRCVAVENTNLRVACPDCINIFANFDYHGNSFLL